MNGNESGYNNEANNECKILRGRVDSLSLYEITEHELDILEKGSPSSLYLNFSIFLLSVGLSFLITLFSADVTGKVFIVFVILSCIGMIGGVFLLFLWYRMKSEVSDIVSKIKLRIGNQETISIISNEQES